MEISIILLIFIVVILLILVIAIIILYIKVYKSKSSDITSTSKEAIVQTDPNDIVYAGKLQVAEQTVDGLTKTGNLVLTGPSAPTYATPLITYLEGTTPKFIPGTRLFSLRWYVNDSGIVQWTKIPGVIEGSYTWNESTGRLTHNIHSQYQFRPQLFIASDVGSYVQGTDGESDDYVNLSRVYLGNNSADPGVAYTGSISFLA